MKPSELRAKYEARAAQLEEEIAVLTARLGKRRPPDPGSSESGLLAFAIEKARANATPEDSARLERLISDTVSTSTHMQAAVRKAQEQHTSLINEFGAEAVAAWKAEHAEVAEDLLRQREQELAPMGVHGLDFKAFVDAFEAEGGEAAAPAARQRRTQK